MTIVIRYLTTGDLAFSYNLCWPKKWINRNLLALVVGSTVCLRRTLRLKQLKPKVKVLHGSFLIKRLLNAVCLLGGLKLKTYNKTLFLSKTTFFYVERVFSHMYFRSLLLSWRKSKIREVFHKLPYILGTFQLKSLFI